ncbi:helix-turn-helix transcriptional regulator [Pseudodesulfovibrio methanolicus]|jgi:transcriptional regulator with XRE-family HTH domain|uniref:Helix-turn-helix domain-containing protein n=1 Tax=Pseudodesulfovibrio methanolicus TaxID=3126690 RepID=A0ABZ2J1E3_9BACT
MKSKLSATAYSRYGREAAILLGQLIRAGRKERGWTAGELADRAGISRRTLQRIEKGDPGCQIGGVFEAAALVGVPLFEAEPSALTRQVRQMEDKLRLLPRSVRVKTREVDDDF